MTNKKRATTHEANAEHLKVVQDVAAALHPGIKKTIENGGPAGVLAQRNLVPLLKTPQHRMTAVYIILAELRVDVIPELEEGLSDWVLETKIDLGLLSPETAALVDSVSTGAPTLTY